jgi:adenylate kinase
MMEQMKPREIVTEKFQLNEAMRRIVRETLEEKGFEILEFNETHVRVKTPHGKFEEMPNRAVVEFCEK